jgi:hypothetical protein
VGSVTCDSVDGQTAGSADVRQSINVVAIVVTTSLSSSLPGNEHA